MVLAGALSLSALGGILASNVPSANPRVPSSDAFQRATARDGVTTQSKAQHNTNTPAQRVELRNTSVDRAALGLGGIHYGRLYDPIWVGRLRDSGVRPRPCSRRGR